MRIIGREQVLTALSAIVDGAAMGRGGAVVLAGALGIGKSALLDAVATRADSRGLLVLRTTATPEGVAVPYGTLTQLLHELPDPAPDELARAVQADADDSARYRLAMVVVQHLASRPTLVLVDSAQWTDEASWQTLALVARRLDPHPTALVAAIRDAPPQMARLAAAGLPELPVPALPVDAARRLLSRATPGLSAAIRERVLSAARGNPLAVIELGRCAAGGRVSATTARLFAELIDPLPEPARLLLDVVARGGDCALREALVAAAAAGGRDVDVADAEPAIRAGLLAVEDGFRLRLRHPLLPVVLRTPLAVVPRPRRSADDLLDADADALHAAVSRFFTTPPDAEARDAFVARATSLGLAEDDPRLVEAISVDPLRHGGVVLTRLTELHRRVDLRPVELFLLGCAAVMITAHDLAGSFFAAALPGLRAGHSLGLLAHGLVAHAMSAVLLGDTRLGVASARQARAVAERTGQAGVATGAVAVLAHAEALRGNVVSARKLLGSLGRGRHALRTRSQQALVCHASAALALAEGRAREAVDELRRVFDESDAAFHPYVRLSAVGLLAEAATLSGRPGTVAFVLDGMAPEVLPLPMAAHGVRYAWAVMAEDGDAEPRFRDALGVDLTAWPFERARLELAFGGWLRRHRRLIQAREALRTAATIFDALRAQPWLARARRELRSAGGAVDGPPSALAGLTEQQRRIARLVADGLTDQEIADRLFLSRRTVTTHLSRIYAQVSARSRADLASKMDDADT